MLYADHSLYDRRPSPPRHWMASEEAISLRAEELARQSGKPLADARKQARAEYAAAAAPVTDRHSVRLH